MLNRIWSSVIECFLPKCILGVVVDFSPVVNILNARSFDRIAHPSFRLLKAVIQVKPVGIAK